VGGVALGELASRFGLELTGDPALVVERVATLANAAPGTLSFLANPRYRAALAGTRASAVVLRRADLAACPVAALVAPDPYLAYARIAQLLHPPSAAAAGVHPSAVVDPGAQVDPGASIGPQVSIGPGARVAAGAVIGPGCAIGAACSVGQGTRLGANVTLYDGVMVGARCLIHSGAVLGADGFGIAASAEGWVKVPQVGGVRLGDDVEVGANTTIDRGAIEDTVLEDGVKLDNQIQVAHNVVIGAHTAIAGGTLIAGSTRIGRRCLIGGGVGIAGHLELVDEVVITARTFVTRSIARAGVYSGALGFDEQRRWQRNAARFHRLDAVARGDKDSGGGEGDA
jgi:UDP-3-O-[3-hydroxymyristoyl] glucosamine N-acyltransferase